MNLRALANAATSRINPNRMVTWIRQTGGYATAPDGTRTPNVTSVPIEAQIQPESSEDQRLAEGLGISGIRVRLFIYGNAHGIMRDAQLGGDKFQFEQYPGAGLKTWKVINAWNWDGWSSVLVAMQNN